MSLLGIMSKRCSTRQFTDKPIPCSAVDAMLWSAVRAPSGANAQNQRFHVYRMSDEIDNLGDIRTPIIRRAACVIAVFIDTEHLQIPDGEESIWAFLNEQNAAASLMSMALVATSCHIGNCWISLNKSMDGTRVLKGTLAEMFPGIDLDRYEPHGLLLLGYPKSADFHDYPRSEESHCGRPVARRPVLEYII